MVAKRVVTDEVVLCSLLFHTGKIKFFLNTKYLFKEIDSDFRICRQNIKS